MTVAIAMEDAALTFQASAALAPNRLVTRDGSNKLEYAAAKTAEVYVTDERALAADQYIAVFRICPDNVYRLTADGVASQYANAYQGASGKVSATPGGRLVGFFLDAAAADGDIVRVVPLAHNPAMAVEAVTADRTVLASECDGRCFTTVGATGAVVFALPAATLGMRVRFRVGAAQELRIDPNGTEKISLPSTGVPGAAGKYLTADANGESVDLACTKAGEWTVFGYTGTWTAEA